MQSASQTGLKHQESKRLLGLVGMSNTGRPGYPRRFSEVSEAGQFGIFFTQVTCLQSHATPMHGAACHENQL